MSKADYTKLIDMNGDNNYELLFDLLTSLFAIWFVVSLYISSMLLPLIELY